MNKPNWDSPSAEIAPLADGAWLDWADPGYLRAAYPQWEASSDNAALAAFAVHGLAAGARLAEGLSFEPDYYAEANPETEFLSTAERYRYWLIEGLALGHPGAPAAHLRLLRLELEDYPAAFPWEYYARLRPQAGAHRWAALADFLETGFAALGDRLVLGAQAGVFLCALGLHYSGAQDALAVRAYERARAAGVLPAEEQQHLADAYLRLGFWRPALDLYRALVAAGAANPWTLRNAIKCARQLGISEALAEDMAAAAPKLALDPLWADTVAEALHAWFEEGENSARAGLAAGDAGAAEEELAGLTAILAARIEILLPPPAHPPAQDGYTLFLVNLDDPGRAHRRVTSKLAMLDRLGQPHRLVPFGAMGQFLAALPGARAVIVFQVPALPAVVLGLVQARRMGCPLYYDSDQDLSGVGPAAPAYHGFVSQADDEELRYGHALYRAAARLCDYGLAPTARLAAALTPLCRTGRGFVIGDLPAMPNVLPMAVPPEEGDQTPCLRLAVQEFHYVDTQPGSKGAMLHDILAAHERLTLSLAGPVKLAPGFSHLGRQIRRDDAETGTAMRASIMLALTGQSAAEEYQAFCVWQEAAAQGIASVLPLTPDALAEARDGLTALRDGETVRCADTPLGWGEALLGLLTDPAGAQRIGAAARAALQARHAALADQQVLADALQFPGIV